MAALTTWDVEYPRPDGETEELDNARCFLAIALERKQWPILEEIVGVEGRLPPLFRLGQKKTGSRYAPKTDSIAARIS